MVVAIFPVNASNNTLELPLTINPLLQDGVEKGSRINPWISSDKEYYSEITFSDFITKLKLKPDVQAKKAIYPLFLLILAAKLDGLSRHDFKFLQRSKWSINMTADDFANVSADIALPVKDNVTLIAVQKAMFKVLEKRFQFTTEEVAEGLNRSKVEIYSCLEPGWIKIVHFITQKNIFRLTQAYDIPPSYIAKSLNMTLVELEDSTLPQLEVILNEKLHIIKGW